MEAKVSCEFSIWTKLVPLDLSTLSEKLLTLHGKAALQSLTANGAADRRSNFRLGKGRKATMVPKGPNGE